MAHFTAENFFPDNSIGYLVRVAHQTTLANLDAVFADEGLTGIQWSALISIHFRRGLTCAMLARDLAHDKGAMTRMIDTLEERGWVTRTRDADDRRFVNLSLTDDGEAVAMRCRLKVIDCWNTWLADWSADEIDAFVAQLHKLRATLEASQSCAA